MGIRIERIKINRGGPLTRDFVLEPRDVNLIYGHNETGKSYIVEAMISLLFRTGRRSAINWALRGWEFAGSVTVSGLEEKPSRFTRGGKKIDDYWTQKIGLPQDFCRLLVVKEGETALTTEKDGVGRDILKNCLSGEGLLDKLETRIPATLREARIQYPRIAGSKRGEIKTWEDSLGERQKLDKLLKRAEEAYTSGTIYDLTQKKESLETELKKLRDAKRYLAKCLHERKETVSKEKQKLPTQEALAKLDSKISLYEYKKRDADNKQDGLKGLERLSNDYAWAEKALKEYEIISRKGVVRPRSLWMILVGVFLGGAIVTGFLKQPTGVALCVIAALGLFVYYFLMMRRALASAAESEELDRLRTEFKRRFGSELTDQALLETKVNDLRDKVVCKRETQRELEERLFPELSHLELSINTELEKYVSRRVPAQKWRKVVSKLRKQANELEDKLRALEKELASLGVTEEEFLVRDPGIAWDASRYEELNEKLESTSKALNEEIDKIDNLKYEIRGATNCESNDWEELIAELRTSHERRVDEYKKLTAEILAKVNLYKVISELRQEENARIASGLKSKELTESLHTITGRYKGMRYDEEEGLVIISDEEEEYPLHDISTGAREQALLTMRLGFSSMLMRGKSAFLILDDAFQHSDWPRRSKLVDCIVSIAENGWQVFYFTMDNHIRDLFMGIRDRLGDRFASYELC